MLRDFTQVFKNTPSNGRRLIISFNQNFKLLIFRVFDVSISFILQITLKSLIKICAWIIYSTIKPANEMRIALKLNRLQAEYEFRPAPVLYTTLLPWNKPIEITDFSESVYGSKCKQYRSKEAFLRHNKVYSFTTHPHCFIAFVYQASYALCIPYAAAFARTPMRRILCIFTCHDLDLSDWFRFALLTAQALRATTLLHFVHWERVCMTFRSFNNSSKNSYNCHNASPHFTSW